jgi:hypothetical protein
VRKYLEKFLTIRFRLCGKSSCGVKAPVWIDDEIKRMFALVEAPFDRLVRDKSVRSSFPNYNFCFRRFFDILGCPQYNVDFPPLKSQKKREDIILIWLKLIHYLKWPYLNSDGDYFGDEYKINARELLRRRRRCASKRRAPESLLPAASPKRIRNASTGDDPPAPVTGSDGESTEVEPPADASSLPKKTANTDASAHRHGRESNYCARSSSPLSPHESLDAILAALDGFADHVDL